MTIKFVNIESKPFTKRLYSDSPGDLTLAVLNGIMRGASSSVKPLLVSRNPLTLEPRLEDVVKKDEIVGFSINSGNLKDSLSEARSIKEKKESIIIMGGPFWDQTSARIVMNDHLFIDFVVRGPAEESLPELYREINNGKDYASITGVSYRSGSEVKHNKDRKLPKLEVLHNLPLPFKEEAAMIDPSLRGELTVPIRTSIGCKGFCSFCYLRGSNWIGIGSDYVVNQFDEYLSMGFKKFLIVDDDFTTDAGRVERIARGLVILQQKHGRFSFEFDTRTDGFGDYKSDNFDHNLVSLLQEAGMNRLFTGIESGNTEDLRCFTKFARNVDPVEQNRFFLRNMISHGVHVMPGFIMLSESTTLDGVRKNIDFITENLPAQVVPEIFCYHISFYPGSIITNKKIAQLELRGEFEEAKRFIYEVIQPKYADENVAQLEKVLNSVRRRFASLEKDIEINKDNELEIVARHGEQLKRVHRSFFMAYADMVEAGVLIDVDKLIEEHYRAVLTILAP